jgi:hypothetical protein
VTNRTCDHCEFYVQNYMEPRIGMCHRFPPTHHTKGYKIFSFPCVSQSHWCGEFRGDASKVGGEDAP